MPKLYIYRSACISPQQTYPDTEIDLLQPYASVDNRLAVREPVYEGIPPGQLRRMGKAVRLGVGAALPLIREAGTPPAGILVGTAATGMEDSIRFMQQITDHQEGILSPGAFVQSTPNMIAGQISLLTRNQSYNITHVQSGLAFENALLDAAMLAQEHNGQTFLVGGADEIGAFNHNIDRLQGFFKEEPLSSSELYASDTPGSLAGEGAAMFLVGSQRRHARACLEGMAMLHSRDPLTVSERLHLFLDGHPGADGEIDLLLSGENGDHRLLPFFEACERVAPSCTVARFKHLCGEYATSPAFSLWLAGWLLENPIPTHMIKRSSARTSIKRVLIYNHFKGFQHSWMLVSAL